MDAGPSVFLTGVTGYLGGSVLTQLLQLDYPPASITCLLRDVSKAAAIEALSTPRTKVITFRGSLEAHDMLAVQVAQHDVVIETASSDDLDGIGAMLQGMRRGGRHPVFIHTSGTGTLVDDARGIFKGHTVYTDQVVDPPEGFKPIDALPDDAFHRPIDLACVQADLDGWCDTYIVLPGTIWGTPQGEIYEKGLANSHSIQVPQMIKSGLDRGQVGYMGKGENSWVHVNIIDCAELYALLYTKVVTFKEKLGHGKDGYYFAVAGEYVRLEVAKSIATALSSHGWISPDLKPFSEEEIDKYFGGKPGGKYYMGTNSRAFPHKAQQLGWKAERSTTRAFYKDCEHEAVRIASEQK